MIIINRKKYVFPLLKIKQKNNRKQIYLFFIPLFNIKYESNEIILRLFNIIPILKTKYYDNKKKKYLFGIIPIFVSSLKIKKINTLFYLRGGYGDIVIILNFLLNLKEKFKDFIEISVLVDKIFFEDIKIFLHKQNFIKNIYKGSKKYINNFDATFFISRTIGIIHCDIEKLYSLNPFYIYIKNYTNILNNLSIDYRGHPEQILERYALIQGRDRIQQMDLDNLIGTKSKLKINLKNEDEVLKKFNLKSTKYITIQNGVGVGLEKINWTRLYPCDKYSKLLKLIKENYNNYKIIQFGYKNNVLVEGVDINICGKTTFEEMLVILKNSSLHIDTECGSIHFRHFLCEKPSLVIFGSTNKNFYGYKENINISSDKQCFGCGCDWITNDWHNKCIKTNSSSSIPCMNIEPEYIFEELQKSGVLKNE